jgi:excisionase family DNA binding protein
MNLDTTNDRLLTVQQAAEFLGVSGIVMLDLINRNVIAASNIGRGSQRPRWRILASDLGKYLVSTRQPVIEPAKPKRATRKATKDYFAEGAK